MVNKGLLHSGHVVGLSLFIQNPNIRSKVGGGGSYLNVKTCSKSVYKRNRPFEVVRLVIQQRAL